MKVHLSGLRMLSEEIWVSGLEEIKKGTALYKNTSLRVTLLLPKIKVGNNYPSHCKSRISSAVFFYN